jgi:hypothetical protein
LCHGQEIHVLNGALQCLVTVRALRLLLQRQRDEAGKTVGMLQASDRYEVKKPRVDVAPAGFGSLSTIGNGDLFQLRQPVAISVGHE